MLKKQSQKQRRQKRVRAKLSGTAIRPRLSVFRSSKYVYAQLIDDDKHKTLASAHSKGVRKSKKSKIDSAKEVGQSIAKLALEKKIDKVVFDRGSYKYPGRIKAVAEGAREGGLKF
ncbi:MAG: 50S ribosomal protein L18 [Candidatus Nealsonbacteria bacterium]